MRNDQEPMSNRLLRWCVVIALALVLMGCSGSAGSSDVSAETPEAPEEPVSPEPASGPVSLTTTGIAEFRFGADFDDVLEFVESVLGEPSSLQRVDGGGCGAILGCELIADWSGDFYITGRYDDNVFTSWLVVTGDELTDTFAVPGVGSLEAATQVDNWDLPIVASISLLDDSWALAIGEDLQGFTIENPPPGNWYGKEPPPFPATATIDYVHMRNWLVEPRVQVSTNDPRNGDTGNEDKGWLDRIAPSV